MPIEPHPPFGSTLDDEGNKVYFMHRAAAKAHGMTIERYMGELSRR